MKGFGVKGGEAGLESSDERVVIVCLGQEHLRDQRVELRVSGFGFWVSDFGFRISGFGCRVSGVG